MKNIRWLRLQPRQGPNADSEAAKKLIIQKNPCRSLLRNCYKVCVKKPENWKEWKNASQNQSNVITHQLVDKIRNKWVQSSLYKTTTLGTTQNWLPWAGGRLIKHLYQSTTDQMHSVHQGINPPSKTPPLSFLQSPPPLNLKTVQAPLFRQSPPSILVFYEFPPP